MCTNHQNGDCLGSLSSHYPNWSSLSLRLSARLFLGSKRDRCLADFDDYWVVIERLSALPVYGRMSLFSTGLELLYETPSLDDQLHIEGSFVFYSAEFASVTGIYRYVDDLTADKRDERQRAWIRAFNGSFWIRSKRNTSNFVATATDSLTNALNLVVGQTTAKAQQEELLLAQGETEIKGLTKQMLGYVGNKFDPLLERMVGPIGGTPGYNG